MKCGVCQASCPTYTATYDEGMVARGRIKLIDALIEGKIELTNELCKKIYSCTSCMSCLKECPLGINPVEIINAARIKCFNSFRSKKILRGLFDIWQRGRNPLIFKSLIYLYSLLPKDSRLSNLFPFTRGGVKRLFPSPKKSLKERLPDILKVTGELRGRVIFFIGCMDELFYQDSCIKGLEILNKAGIEVIIPKGLYCCGGPSYYLGDIDNFLNTAAHNSKIINRYGDIDAVITDCATCVTTLKLYKKIISDNTGIRPEIYDLNRFLTEKISIKDPFKGKGRKIRVTYHDPCHFRMDKESQTAARKFLKSIDGITLIEMSEPGACCGGAGIFSFKNYDISLDIAKKKVASIIETGADIVATSCPSCQMHIKDSLHREGIDIEVVHPVSLVD